MKQAQFLLGYDIGSSSVKSSLLDIDTGKASAISQSPERELEIKSGKQGYAEQDPATWWEHIKIATHKLIQVSGIHPDQVCGIGISYQMHGLVAVDNNGTPLRPAIIWCDSRASDIGKQAFNDLGHEWCLKNYLNSPGNFTASKLKWVKENEPEIYANIHKIMLPGDYIAFKLTGEISTTISGLSEGIFWDYTSGSVAASLLDYYKIPSVLLPPAHSSFTTNGTLTALSADEIGLKKGIPVSYRSGDQPNNAFSLNVLNPGEAATTAGTSGVIYGVTNQPVYDEKSRVNTFIHVNHKQDNSSYGVLLCINGTGILYRWLKEQLSESNTFNYDHLNNLASQTPIGADGMTILPFGNGSERILENKNPGAQISGIDFNRHDKRHLIRAGLEGIVFSMKYGLSVMSKMGVDVSTVKAGHANLFLSPVFREIFVNTNNVSLELYNTNGAEGAARGAGIGTGVFSSFDDAFKGLEKIEQINPNPSSTEKYEQFYQTWKEKLKTII